MPDVTLEPLLNLKQASQVLNLAPVTVRKLASKGRLPVVRLNHKLLFEQETLRRFIRDHTTP